MNGEHAAIHYTNSSIGSVDYEISDTSGPYYTSMILSKWKENGSICMDVVLIASMNELRPIEVTCRGATLLKVMNETNLNISTTKLVVEWVLF